MIPKPHIFIFLFMVFMAQPAHAAPPAGAIPGQSWEDALKSIETQHKGLRKAENIQDKLFTPATNEGVDYSTMDGSQQFKAAYSCRTSSPVLIIKGVAGAAGELTATIEYSAAGDGSMSTLRVGRIAGACVGGAVFECNPAGSWSKCKYGVYEFQNNKLVLSHTYPGGVARDPVGMKGCFCFSSYCGSTAGMYMETILRHMGQGIVDQIVAANRNLVVAEPSYDKDTATMTWYTGNVDDCTPLGSYNIAELTNQYGRMDLDYQGTINKQEPGSPWDILSKSMEKPRNQYICTKKAKASSEFKSLLRKVDATFGIGWDRDGGSKDCYWFQGRSCGNAFGEPRSWDACVSQAQSNFTRICNEMFVKNGHFNYISHIANPRAISGIGNLISCYGSGNDGYDQWWMMECWGYRYDDYFICNSSNKSKPGTTIFNEPYNQSLYDGCSEVREIENGCAQLEARDDCYLIDEKTDGVYTVMNMNNTGLAPTPKCREVKGARSSIVVCEPWWDIERKYECRDTIEGFDKEKERARHVTQNTALDGNKYLSTVGDLQFGANGQGVRKVIDANIQFDNKQQPCTPACVVQREVPNYTLVLPGQRQTGENANEHVGESVEPSIIPGGTTTLIETLDCVPSGDAYTCPVEQGWSLRSQCSCADGSEFANAITMLMALNEVGKDLICSTGEPAGVCDSEDEGAQPYKVLCGDFDRNAAGLVSVGEVWECAPKLWRGTQVPNQTHLVTVDGNYRCQATAEGLAEDDHFENDLGPLVPQKGWFDEAVVWAKALIARDIQKEGSDWYSKIQCNGCSGFKNEIDICQPLPGTTKSICLSSNQQYESYQACKQSCTGRATNNNEQGICLWKDNLAGIQDAAIGVQYNLKLQPAAEAVFGDLRLSGTYTTAIEKADPFPYCFPKQIQGPGTATYVQHPCSTVTNEAVVSYQCSLTEAVFGTSALCTQNCRQLRYKCASGDLVDSPGECVKNGYGCSSTSANYASLDDCTGACTFKGVTNSRVCASSTTSRGYSLFLKKGGNPLLQTLEYVPVTGARQKLSETTYNYNSRIVQQCVDRHVTPYISLDEPGTKAHFEVGHADILAYQFAASRGQLPSKDGQLPPQPAVYRGSALRKADVNDQKQTTDIVNDDDTITTVPNTELSPEDLKELENPKGNTTVGSDGLSKPVNGGMLVPRAPMFLAKSWSASYQKSGSSFGQLGGSRITLGSLVPYVYYYECPKGTNRQSATNTCGGKQSFGGVAETISGKWCFQFFCDETAMTDPDASQYSGCGLVNDGWKK